MTRVREEAIKQLKWYFEKDDGTGADSSIKKAYEVAIKALKEEPRIKAKWVFGTTMNRGWMKCSNCCVSQTPCGTFSYCPNCGAEMEVESDGGNS